MNAQVYKNQYRLPNLLEQLVVAAQIINSQSSGSVWFTSLDHKYAFSQLQMSDLVSSRCSFKKVCGEFTGTYCFKTGFYGLTDMPKEFQKAMDNTLQDILGVICFHDDVLIVSRGSVEDLIRTVEKLFQKLNKGDFALKLSNCNFSVEKITCLGFDIDKFGYIPRNSTVEAVLDLKP